VIGELADAMTSTGQRLGELHDGLWQANRELERRIDERTRELIERNRMLESVVNTISHDLRATAVSMHALAGAVLEGQEGRRTAESTRMLQRLLTLTEHQERLLRDLLTLVRLGKEPPQPREVNLNQLLKEALDDCGAEATPASMTLRLSNSRPIVWADPSRLREALLHLVQNAIKFRDSTRELAIEISVEERVGWIQCAVRDNGIGIDPAYHGKIFDLFHRLQEVDTEGTGAGLTIVKQIIEQWGGRIWIESKKGHGTTVSFTIPRSVALTGPQYIEASR
jgi:signal transduction histidine kinase